MLDLEHLLLFGLPENKLEWYDGRAHCRLPFTGRGAAEAAFTRCADTLARWQGLDGAPAIARRGDVWRTAAGGITLELTARVLEAAIPIWPDAIHEFQERFWQPSLWPRDGSVPPGGGSSFWQWGEARMNVAIYLMGITDSRRNGWSCGRVDVVLPGLGIVQPDAFYYAPHRQGCLIDDAYFVGAPDLVIEVMAPATAAWTRGIRAELYRRAGIPSYWIAIPETGAIETWALEAGGYVQTGSHVVGERFGHPLFPDTEVDVSELLRSRWGVQQMPAEPSDREPSDVASIHRPIPLQNLLLAGHPDRRYEVIQGRTPCIVAFGSEAVAEQRFSEWSDETAQWDAERFSLRRDGPRVSLDVATDLGVYDEILAAYHSHDVWDEFHRAMEQSGSSWGS